MGGFGLVCFFSGADWPGRGGLGGDWAGMTRSSPDASDSLSDLEVGRSFCDAQSFFASFAGNRVSLNFTSWEISMRWWAVSQSWYPLVPWNLVHNQQRSFLGSLAQVWISSFLECAPKLDNQRL